MPRSGKFSFPLPRAGDRILAFLEETRDWLSGEELARQLGMSRAAVAKHIDKLRQGGHYIESATKRGYRLVVKNMPLDPAVVQADLGTKVLGRTGWRALREVESTNNEAIAWALQGGPAGAVVTAEMQTGGKGRRGHAWFSAPRSIQFSCILGPEKNEPVDADALTTGALAALRGAFMKAGLPEPVMKQPNDLFLDGKKVAGILVESGSRAGVPEWTVLGIGLNVNVLEDEFPRDLSGRVTSLLAVTGREVDRNRLLAVILNEIERARLL